MKVKQSRLYLALICLGVCGAIGSLFPWITVALFTVRGTDSWRGLVILVAGLSLSTLCYVKLREVQILAKTYSRLLTAVTLIVAIALGVLGEVAYRTLKASSEIQNYVNTNDAGLGGFGGELNNLVGTFTSALRPELALGWYLSAGCFSISLLLLVLGQIQKRSSGTTHFTELIDPYQERNVTERIFTSKAKRLVVMVTSVLCLILLLGWYVGKAISKPKPYSATYDVTAVAQKISRWVDGEAEEFKKIDWIQYSNNWQMNRLTKIKKSFQNLAEIELPLSYKIGREFYERDYSNEEEISGLFEDFMTANVNVQSAVDSAHDCSTKSESQGSCMAEFEELDRTISEIQEITNKLTDFLK